MSTRAMNSFFERTRKQLADFVKQQLWKMYFEIRWSYIGNIGYSMYMKHKEIPEEQIQNLQLKVIFALLQAFQEPWPELFKEASEQVEKSKNYFTADTASEIGESLSNGFAQRIEKLESKHNEALRSISVELNDLKTKTSVELERLRKEKEELEIKLQKEIQEKKKLHQSISDQNRIIADLDAQLQMLKESL